VGGGIGQCVGLGFVGQNAGCLEGDAIGDAIGVGVAS
jgi:hypothetical protein